MKKIILLLSLFCGAALFSEEFVTVYKDGNDFFVRSSFSETEDIVIHNWRYANEKAYLIPKGTPIQKCTKGKRLHSAGDEYPATAPLGKFSTLSGNHGSIFTRRLTVAGHKFTDKDLGGVITEKNGTAYIIMQIIDKDRILIHPEGKDDTRDPKFTRHSNAKLFYKGKEIPFSKSEVRQLYPLNRITDCRLLADGVKAVPEKKEIKCRFVDYIFTHDVLNPYHVVQTVKKTPGKKGFPLWQGNHCMHYVHTPELRKKYAPYMELPALATYYNKFRFEPRGANVNYRKAVYHVSLSEVNSLDVMFMWNGLIGNQKKQLFYIPKLKPFTTLSRDKKSSYTIDFTAGYPLPRKLNISYSVGRKNLLNADDFPDRYIRVTGNDSYQYGIALGYSLFMGCTAKGQDPGVRTRFYHLYRTHKMYPYAYSLRRNKPGTTMEVVAYRQYFNPQIEPDATSFYCHRQGKSLIVYLDFHKILKDKTVKLPKAAAGKKITVLEKTPAMTLHTAKNVPASGITLSNGAKHGYIVLKLD